MQSSARAGLVGIAVLSLAAAGVVASELKAKVAREKVAKVLGFDKPDRVRIKDISQMGNEAVVEAQFDGAFRFTVDKDGEWNPVEVRTGDRRWESIDLIETAIRKEKILRTTADLRTLATALESLRRERGSYVAASSGAALIDRLSPAYVKTVMRLDAWSHEFDYSGQASSYRLSSRGPDGVAGTGDDIVFENGQLVKGSTE
jgi:hypothetical protein